VTSKTPFLLRYDTVTNKLVIDTPFSAADVGSFVIEIKVETADGRILWITFTLDIMSPKLDSPQELNDPILYL